METLDVDVDEGLLFNISFSHRGALPAVLGHGLRASFYENLIDRSWEMNIEVPFKIRQYSAMDIFGIIFSVRHSLY